MSTQHKVTALAATSGPIKGRFGGWFARFDATCADGAVYPITEHRDLKRDIVAKIENPASMLGEPTGARSKFVLVDDDGKVVGTMIRFDLRVAAS